MDLCKFCKFFCSKYDEVGSGFCRRYPPKPVVCNDDDWDGILPITYETGYCGEWKQKNPAEDFRIEPEIENIKNKQVDTKISDEEKKVKACKTKEFWIEHLEYYADDLHLTIKGNPFLSDVEEIVITKSGWEIREKKDERIVNIFRVERCRNSLQSFCEEYLDRIFCNKFLPFQESALNLVQKAINEKDNQAIQMNRGDGLTSIAIASAIWSLLYSKNKKGVFITEEKSKLDCIYNAIKLEFEINENLKTDFKEIIDNITYDWRVLLSKNNDYVIHFSVFPYQSNVSSYESVVIHDYQNLLIVGSYS